MNTRTALESALTEIGEITPRWSEDDGLYLFDHPLYPWVDYLADTPEKVIEGYKEVLQDFIEDRIKGKVSSITDQSTPGRGGVRPGAGRPKGTTYPPRIRLSLPVDIAHWLKGQPDHWEQVRKIMG